MAYAVIALIVVGGFIAYWLEREYYVSHALGKFGGALMAGWLIWAIFTGVIGESGKSREYTDCDLRWDGRTNPIICN